MNLISGISHITLICKNLQKSSELFCQLLGAMEVYSSEEHPFSISQEKFLLLGDLWIALMQGDAIDRSYNHIAFQVDEEKLADLEKNIRAYGLEILPSRPKHAREGKSVYFYDYDNHLFELHTGTLHTRLNYYREVKT